MENEAKIKKISELIVKTTRQELTEEDKTFLDRWLDESKDHRELYSRLREAQYAMEQYRLQQHVDPGKAWRKVIASSRRRVLRYTSYAAAMVFLLGAASTYLLLPDTRGHVQQETTVATNAILPGVGKATLIVAGQQEMQLGKGNVIAMTDSAGVKYQNDSSTLYYQSERPVNSITSPDDTHTLVVGRGGEYSVQLADGTKVFLNSESKLSYPAIFTGNERRVHLEGEAYFEVMPDRNHPFIVEGKDFAVKVLGTSFNVSNYKDDDLSRIVLLEGSVQVKKANKAYKLIPNEALEINGDQIDVKKINATNAISWKNDKFYFSNERLETVMMKLARWYDVNVFYTNQAIKDYHFTGFIPKYADITKAFAILELTADVRFEVKDKTITITRSE